MTSSPLVPLLQKLVGIWLQRECLSSATLERMKDTLQVLDEVGDEQSSAHANEGFAGAPKPPSASSLPADAAQAPALGSESPLAAVPETVWQPSAPAATGASGEPHAASRLLAALAAPPQAEVSALREVRAAQAAEAKARVAAASCSAELHAALAQVQSYTLQRAPQHSDAGTGGDSGSPAAAPSPPYDIPATEAVLLAAQAKLRQHEEAAENLAGVLERVIGALSDGHCSLPPENMADALHLAQEWGRLKEDLPVVKGGAALQRLMAHNEQEVLRHASGAEGEQAVPLGMHSVTRLLAANVRAKWHAVVVPAFQEEEAAAEEARKAELKREEEAAAAAAARGEVPARLRELGVVAMGPGVSLSRAVALVPLARTPPLAQQEYGQDPLGLPAPPPMSGAPPPMMGGGGFGSAPPPMMSGAYGQAGSYQPVAQHSSDQYGYGGAAPPPMMGRGAYASAPYGGGYSSGGGGYTPQGGGYGTQNSGSSLMGAPPAYGAVQAGAPYGAQPAWGGPHGAARGGYKRGRYDAH